MENMVSLTIDSVPVEVPVGTTVLEAARKAHVHIPTLCFMKDTNQIGACRICCVDVGARTLQAACVYPVAEGMVVKTNTPDVRESRRTNLELILSNHDRKCLSCVRSQNCELQKLCSEMGVEEETRFEGKKNDLPEDTLSPSVVRDPKKCILCRRCISTCKNIQRINVIGATGRGFDTGVGSAWGHSLGEVACVNCGQCIVSCPVGALREKDATEQVWDLINNPDIQVFVQTAPAVRAALGEPFGMPMGTSVTGKMAAALRRMGFDKVFDTDFGADLTIMEEGTEFLDRLQNGGKLPMITSCSPGWIKYCEHFHPEFLPNLSSCKSPHEMLGAVLKSYYAEKHGIDPKKMAVVSVMPCTAKKFECARPELSHNGMQDVDVVITTRELSRMIKEAAIDFVNLPDEEFDDMLGDSTGAAVIFGATGGVMEAALRTVYEIVTGERLQKVDFDEVRGTEGIKEATIRIGDIDVNVAVAHGTGNAHRLLKRVQKGEKQYHFIEVMGCPGGCVTGGGQPIQPNEVWMEVDPRQVRAKALYGEDKGKTLRVSKDNPSIQKLYADYLEKPNSHLAHELLHTKYTERSKY